MPTKKQTIYIHIIISCLVPAAFSHTAYARSVYAITNHESSVITAYDVNGAAIDYQTDISAHWGFGAVGLALDPDSQILFVTYEGSDVIEMLNAKTMIYEQDALTAYKPRIYTAFSEFLSKNQNFSQHLPFQRRHIYGSAAQACPADFSDLPPRVCPNAVFVRIYLVCRLSRCYNNIIDRPYSGERTRP